MVDQQESVIAEIASTLPGEGFITPRYDWTPRELTALRRVLPSPGEKEGRKESPSVISLSQLGQTVAL